MQIAQNDSDAVVTDQQGGKSPRRAEFEAVQPCSAMRLDKIPECKHAGKIFSSPCNFLVAAMAM